MLYLFKFLHLNVFVTEKYEVIPSLFRLRIVEMASSASDGIPLYVAFY
jgi:hypothetical protein